MYFSLNPIKLFLDGFDWNGRTSRRQLGIVLFLGILPSSISALLGYIGYDALWARSLLILFAALFFIPLVGHLVRRINDLGWNGWLVWLVVVPYVAFAFLLVLLFKSRGYKRPIYSTLWRLVGQVATAVVAFVMLTGVFWRPYFVISGAMKPNLLVGDYVIATVFTTQPEVGEMTVFRHPVSGIPTVSRVIGIEGDSVQMRGGTLWINGVEAETVSDGFFDEVMEPQGPLGLLPRCTNGAVGQFANCRKTQERETLSNGVSYPILNIGKTALDQTGEFTVPEGHVFVLGDNRDNAADSRIAVGAGGTGFVPVENLIGHPLFVLYSVSSARSWAIWTMRLNRIFVGSE